MSEEHTCYESREGPVDPAANEDHGEHVGDVTFHHVCQHTGICENTQRTTCKSSDFSTLIQFYVFH